MVRALPWTPRRRGIWIGGAIEVAALAAWAAEVARPYLNLDPEVVPSGREFLSNIQTHHLWTRLVECGDCALWNGSFRGGYPALADPHGSMLHPLVAVTTLAWGVFNGSKVALAGALLMAGIAQWLLGRTLGTGVVARTWTAGLAIAGGHLAGRMEPGNFGLVLSTASCALALPAAIFLARCPTWRAAILLGAALALVAVSGQGYMQVGLAIVLPAAGIALFYPPRAPVRAIVSRLAGAALIAFLLAAPLLVPLAHFLPEFGKDTDLAFQSAQPLQYVPLNLVIADGDFFRSTALGKLQFPYLYTSFVGWLAAVLGIAGAAIAVAASGERRRQAVFLVAFFLVALWVASAAPFQWLARYAPTPELRLQFSGFRYVPVVAGLAVPALLGLAAIGAEALLTTIAARLRLSRRIPRARRRRAAPWAQIGATGVLALVLFGMWRSLDDARAFARQWIQTQAHSPELRLVLDALRTPDAQWVNTPFGEQFWIEPAVAAGLKLSLGTQGWYWKDRPPPPAEREAHRTVIPPDMRAIDVVGRVPIYEASEGREYAAVVQAGGARTPCRARASGGHISVACQAAAPGTLVVRENSWSGWRASLDGAATALRPSRWLEVAIPAGAHEVTFRYAPWDAALGLFLFVVGVALAALGLVCGEALPSRLASAGARAGAVVWRRARRGQPGRTS